MKRVELDPRIFDAKEPFKLSRKAKRGIATTLLAFSMISISGCNDGNDLYVDNSKYEEINQVIPDEKLAMNMEDINQLNIIINDNDCGDAFFENVCANLDQYGLNFSVSKQNEGIQQENATIITLDQVYSSGPNVLLVGSKDDNTANKSEALLMSCQAEMYRQGYNSIMISGLQEYQQQDNGDVFNKKIASPTEEMAADSSSFVTISFGTSNDNERLVAKTIINSLGRYNYFLNNTYGLIPETKNDTTETDYITTDNSYCISNQMMHLQEFNFQTEIAVDNTKEYGK